MKFKGFSILELLQTGEHQAKALLTQLQDDKMVKKCYHAQITEYPGGYKVECAKNSFVINKEYYSKSTFLGCPNNCLAYRTEWSGKVNSYCLDCFYTIKAFIRNRWSDFLGLSSWVQIFIIAVMALILKAPLIYWIAVDIIKCKLS